MVSILPTLHAGSSLASARHGADVLAGELGAIWSPSARARGHSALRSNAVHSITKVWHAALGLRRNFGEETRLTLVMLVVRFHRQSDSPSGSNEFLANSSVLLHFQQLLLPSASFECLVPFLLHAVLRGAARRQSWTVDVPASHPHVIFLFLPPILELLGSPELLFNNVQLALVFLEVDDAPGAVDLTFASPTWFPRRVRRRTRFVQMRLHSVILEVVAHVWITQGVILFAPE